MPTPLLLARGRPPWPAGWDDLRDSPAQVHVTGDPSALAAPAVAVVGTRGATSRGLAVAERLAADLAMAGWTIASGLALGIDAAAHRGALAAGGRTVAVMATGIEITYPSRHRALRRQIEASGCAVTELPSGVTPHRHQFPRRNRLIAALAAGVVVVEAPRRSGALLTAYLALDLGREVFAVPGPVDREESRGCHHLLRQGGVLVESAADVVRELGQPEATRDVVRADARGNGTLRPAPGSPARWIWDRLDLEGVCRDDLRRRWCGSEGAWAEGMLALELAGLIRRLPGGRLARTIWDP
ncbi:MAG: DNA-processing protein DprA [Candidatus Krumholzibacteriia bacterium]